MIIDDVDRHLDEAGTFDRAAVVPGVFLAWCVNVGLASEAFLREAESAVLRLRYRDMAPGAFFVSTCGGELASERLSDAGRAFAGRYYGDYLTAFPAIVGIESLAQAEDGWAFYDRAAAWLTARHLGRAPADEHATDHNGGRKRWWRFWK